LVDAANRAYPVKMGQCVAAERGKLSHIGTIGATFAVAGGKQERELRP
jgi:hypothetical protein